MRITNFALFKNSNLLSHPATPGTIGHPFIVLSLVDSSNNYAMGQVQAGLATHGTAYFARQQTAGKGQRGKSWLTNPNENIIISMVLTPGLQVADQFLLSASVALGCYDFYKKYAGDETRIKWPNDLYWRDRKAGGILIENSFRGNEWLFAIAGIGININQVHFDPGIGNPVSLKQVTGKSFDVLQLAHQLCAAIDHRYQAIGTLPDAAILQQYEHALYKLHQPVLLKKETAIFETVITGISPTGRLLTKDTIERQFDFGEVEWVIR